MTKATSARSPMKRENRFHNGTSLQLKTSDTTITGRLCYVSYETDVERAAV